MDYSSIVLRMDALVKAVGMAKGAFYSSVGITSASVSGWRSGSTKPTVDNLEKCAEVLGVSLKWLMFGDDEDAKKAPNENIESNREIDLSADEWKLIAYYRDLSEQGKQKVLDYVADLLLAGIYKRHNKHEMVSGG